MVDNAMAGRKSKWGYVATIALGNLSRLGLLVGSLLFASALTPTLVPRDPLPQGALAGLCFFIGYAIGALVTWLWVYLGLPRIDRRQTPTRYAAAVVSLAFVVAALWRSADWQNSVRHAVGMPPVDSFNPFIVCGIAAVTFAVLLVLARLAKGLAVVIDRPMRRYIPPRVAITLAVTLTTVILWSLASDVLARAVFRLLDASYRQYDALLEPERPQPEEAQRTGSSASLISWNEFCLLYTSDAADE